MNILQNLLLSIGLFFIQPLFIVGTILVLLSKVEGSVIIANS